MRWRLILCAWGLILFGLITYASVQRDREIREMRRPHFHSHYFWWGYLRLDTDPLLMRSGLNPCAPEPGGTCYVDLEVRWGEPGWLEEALFLTAFPAFLLTAVLMRGPTYFGVSQLLSFMITMPILTFAWFYTIGWLLDRWRYKRSLRRASVSS